MPVPDHPGAFPLAVHTGAAPDPGRAIRNEAEEPVHVPDFRHSYP